MPRSIVAGRYAADPPAVKAQRRLRCAGRRVPRRPRHRVPLTGSVELSLYSPGAALFGDPQGYYPATVPDEDRPARIALQAVEGDRLTLSVHDRVDVRSASGTSFRTLVTAVEGDGTVELGDPVLVRQDQPNEFLVGKIGEEDPTGWVDQFLLNELHIGWMQYFHDPYGQIQYRAQPRDLGGQIAARSARYLFGTQSWMCLFPLGFFWLDNALKRANPHRSSMEQEASRKSGDTYCPLGTLHGDLTVVGDVARYWFTVVGGTRDGFSNQPNVPADLLTLNVQDAPGVNLTPAPTLVLPAGAGAVVPRDFYRVTAAGAFNGIGARGWIPASAQLERSGGIHVAFTRPPAAGAQYQITAQASGNVQAGALANSADAQSKGVATLSFTRAPGDVTVTLATLPVAEGATIDLIPFQRAAFDVTPNGPRVYRATVTEPGATFDVADGLELVARAAIATEEVEISRFHRWDSATGAFESGIGPVHLPADIHIAVRRLLARVTDRIPLRATVDQTAAAVTSVRPGDRGFVLVPAPLAPAPIATAVTGTPSLTPQLNPVAAVPATAQAFLRDGGAFDVVFPAEQPPEQRATVTITIPVGPDAASAVPVRCEVIVDPHFTLDGPAQVARGSSVTLRASDGTTLQSATTVPGITVTPTGAEISVQVDGGTALPSVTVVVRDAGAAQRMARRTLPIV